MKIVNPKFNASHELIAFDGLTLDSKNKVIESPENAKVLKAMKELPRISEYTGSSAPRVVVDGTEYALSYKFYTDKEKETYTNYRAGHSGTGGSGTKSKIPEAVLKELMDPKIFGKLSEESQAFLKSLNVDPKVVKIAKMLGVKPEELTEAQLKAIEALGL